MVGRARRDAALVACGEPGVECAEIALPRVAVRVQVDRRSVDRVPDERPDRVQVGGTRVEHCEARDLRSIFGVQGRLDDEPMLVELRVEGVVNLPAADPGMRRRLRRALHLGPCPREMLAETLLQQPSRPRKKCAKKSVDGVDCGRWVATQLGMATRIVRST